MPLLKRLNDLARHVTTLHLYYHMYLFWISCLLTYSSFPKSNQYQMKPFPSGQEHTATVGSCCILTHSALQHIHNEGILSYIIQRLNCVLCIDGMQFHK